MNSFIRLPFIDGNGKFDLPAATGLLVTVVLAIWIAKKTPLLKKAV